MSDSDYLPDDELSERARSMCGLLRELIRCGDQGFVLLGEPPDGDRDRAFAFGAQGWDGQRFRITVEPSPRRSE